jgi:peptide/nickel transport system permease protein
MAEIVRYTRASMLTVLRQDYIKTARSKGIGEVKVLYQHALKNACIPVVTVLGLLLPRLVGGAAVTETVFSWPGMGRLAVGAAMVIVCNLLTDLCYIYLISESTYPL